jgi:hypothetical protein
MEGLLSIAEPRETTMAPTARPTVQWCDRPETFVGVGSGGGPMVRSSLAMGC